MNKALLTAVAALALFSAATCTHAAQAFDSGSNGSFGPLNVTADTNLPLPADGILNCTTISVAAGATLTFTKNALNTPVYLLAQGDVTIDGKIDVSGKPPAAPFVGGIGGPGGYDGGTAGFSTGNASLQGGDGQGPGAGKHGSTDVVAGAGGGSFGAQSDQLRNWNNKNVGPAYGTVALIPMVGGSGAGGIDGNANQGGGGGGGAILIASSTRITVTPAGVINANGVTTPGTSISGSGGAIRLIAPRIYGSGSLNTGIAGGYGGVGRIRIDSIYKYEPTDPVNSNLALKYNGVTSVGSTLIVFPPNQPHLDLIKAAGTTIAEGAPSAVQVQLPFGADPNQTVTVQAKNFGAKVPIHVVLTPQSGDSIGYDAEIDNTTANPASTVVNVKFPINTLVQVTAWTQ